VDRQATANNASDHQPRENSCPHRCGSRCPMVRFTIPAGSTTCRNEHRPASKVGQELATVYGHTLETPTVDAVGQAGVPARLSAAAAAGTTKPQGHLDRRHQHGDTIRLASARTPRTINVASVGPLWRARHRPKTVTPRCSSPTRPQIPFSDGKKRVSFTPANRCGTSSDDR